MIKKKKQKTKQREKQGDQCRAGECSSGRRTVTLAAADQRQKREQGQATGVKGQTTEQKRYQSQSRKC